MKYFYFFCALLVLVTCKESSVDSKLKEIYLPNSLQAKDLDTLQVWVTSISDGDSFTALNNDNEQIEVRMLFIDTPERYQPYSIVAKQFTANRIFQDSVTLYTQGKDQYGRWLSLVVTSEGEVLNEELLKNGLAWHFKQFSKDKVYQAYEDEARSKQVGLFQDYKPIAPWEWRHHKSRYN